MRRKLKLALIASCLASIGLPGAQAASVQEQRPPVLAPSADVQVAAICGYFAILHCSRSYRTANSWNKRFDGGYVIDTSSYDYPNFRSGYYCVVEGPTSLRNARAIARDWRRYGSPDAYVKNSC